MFLIDEINLMDEIDSIEQAAKEQYNIDVLNVSHWNSSLTFQNNMNQVLVLPPPALPWNYCYSYSISDNIRQQVLRNLGISSEQLPNTMALILQSSTIAIVNIINLLVRYKKKKICILQPSYFSVVSCCAAFSLNYDTKEIIFQNGQPRIPINEILAGGYDCVWITSPIYCTGYCFDTDCIKEILRLRNCGIMVILDESLALPGTELLHMLPIDPNIFMIYSPHKAIALNGLKFSVIVCDKCYEEFLEQWLDIFSGSLLTSNRDAVFHYLSSNYLDKCVPTYKTYITERKKAVEQLIQYFPFASMLPNTEGHYVSIFTNIQIFKPETILSLIKKMIFEKGVSFFPGTINGFSLNQNLNFRINLTNDPVKLLDAIGKILTYLENYDYKRYEIIID